MKFKLNPYHRNTPDKDLLDDLIKIASKLNKDKITAQEYKGGGGIFSSNTVSNRFGTWNKALEKAGLKITKKPNIIEKELFENIEEVWIKLGRQPLYSDIKRPLSKFSTKPYEKKYGTWRKTLEAFIEYIEYKDEKSEEVELEENNSDANQELGIVYKHKTKRNISERLKVQVLMRDGNKCKLCGITLTGDNIHFDHIIPWSKGGETVLENIQVLCVKHNLAKGNILNK
jgi:hypothetical protein